MGICSLTERLDQLEKRGLLRRLRPPMQLGIDFHSNDYLGLTFSSAFREGLLKQLASSTLPLGSGGSRLISGNFPHLEALEEKIRVFHGGDQAVVFQSGYLANIALLSALGRAETWMIYDEKVHASIKEGIRYSACSSQPFRHNDCDHLRKRLKNHPGAFVVVESLYSMDGDFSPLREIANLCEEYDGKLIVDEAHSVGLYGLGGRGLVHEHRLQDRVFATVVTYGKAFGCQGAAVIGRRPIKEFLINQSFPVIYSTAPSGLLVAAIDVAYDIVAAADDLRAKLFKQVAYFRNKIDELPQRYWLLSTSPIQGMLLPLRDLLTLEKQVRDAGLLVTGIRSPTVRNREERLRLIIHAFNSTDEIDHLMGLLGGLK